MGYEVNSLTFVIETDHATIDGILAELREILSKYPVKGKVT